MAKEKLMAELATGNCLAIATFIGFIAPYMSLLRYEHMIYKLAEEEKCQLGRDYMTSISYLIRIVNMLHSI
jgi:hypothetical protein